MSFPPKTLQRASEVHLALIKSGIVPPEVAQRAAERARKAAKDAGTLPEEELKKDEEAALRAAKDKAVLQAADTNGDGVLDAQEFVSAGLGTKEQFDAADADGDGKVTFDELRAKTEKEVAVARRSGLGTYIAAAAVGIAAVVIGIALFRRSRSNQPKTTSR